MNRCLRLSLRFSLSVALAASALAALPAGAQTDTTTATPTVRQFPAGVVRGEMVVVQPPQITIDGKADQLTPGARIRDTASRLVFSSQLVGQTLVVNYLRENGAGGVHQVWVLTPEEAKVRLPGMKRSWFDILSGQPADDAATTTTK